MARLNIRRVAKSMAKQVGEATRAWNDEDFEGYVLEHPDWESILEVSWSHGSFAGVERLRKGMFKSYDDAGVYGTYSTFEEAFSHISVFAGDDEIDRFWVADEYKAMVEEVNGGSAGC